METDEITSDCCGAAIYENADICTACKDHCEPYQEDFFIGQKVLWFGSWGNDQPKKAIIETIDFLKVKGIFQNIYTLDNGKWCYEYQIKSL